MIDIDIYFMYTQHDIEWNEKFERRGEEREEEGEEVVVVAVPLGCEDVYMEKEVCCWKVRWVVVLNQRSSNSTSIIQKDNSFVFSYFHSFRK